MPTGPRRRTRSRSHLVWASLAAVTLVGGLVGGLTGCGADAPRSGASSGTTAPTSPRSDQGASGTAAPSSGSPAPSSAPTDAPTDAPTGAPSGRPTSFTSLADVADAPPQGRDLTVVEVLARTPGYERTQITYRSDGRTVSGVLTVPTGPGPFPAVVTAHGYVPVRTYRVGQGLIREEVALARAGFASLHTDYRGYGESDPLDQFQGQLHLEYVRDILNAADVLAHDERIDPERLAVLGRSMGGGLALDAVTTHPDLFSAAVLYSPISSRFLDNLHIFTPGHRAEVHAMFDAFGTPRRAPDFYRGLSSRFAFSRITAPVLIHHGLADTVCPPDWSETTERLLTRDGVEATRYTYPGEEHVFMRLWGQAMTRTVDFLQDTLIEE